MRGLLTRAERTRRALDSRAFACYTWFNMVERQRTETIALRLTLKERELIESAAHADGRTLSAWIRWIVKQRLEHEKKRRSGAR